MLSRYRREDNSGQWSRRDEPRGELRSSGYDVLDDVDVVEPLSSEEQTVAALNLDTSDHCRGWVPKVSMADCWSVLVSLRDRPKSCTP